MSVPKNYASWHTSDEDSITFGHRDGTDPFEFIIERDGPDFFFEISIRDATAGLSLSREDAKALSAWLSKACP